MTARVSLLLTAFAAMALGGQMGRGHPAHLPVQRFATDGGLPPVLPMPPLISTRAHRPLFRAPGFFPYAPVYIGHSVYPPAPVSNVVIVQLAPTPPPAAVVPPAPRPELREFSWPAPRVAEPQYFSIALRGGLVHSARVVWQDDHRLCFITREGERRQVPLEELDRGATERLNREKNLTVPWP